MENTTSEISKKRKLRVKYQNRDLDWLIEQAEKVEQLQKEINELREENIGVALYETKLLYKKVNPEEQSSIGRHFKHIIETLEQ